MRKTSSLVSALALILLKQENFNYSAYCPAYRTALVCQTLVPDSLEWQLFQCIHCNFESEFDISYNVRQ